MMSNMNEKSILVIDDDHTSRVAIEQCLYAEGYDILMAGSSTSALEILKEVPVDAVISDWHLGNTQGTEILQRVRHGASPVKSNLPFLIITGVYTQPEDLEHAFKLGATDYIEKPITLNRLSLINRLKKALIAYDQFLKVEESLEKEENLRISKVNIYEEMIRNFKANIEEMIATTPLHKNKLTGLLYDYESELSKLHGRDSVKDETEHVFPGFAHKLQDKYPKLSEDDILICCCLLLKEGNQTIASRLNMSDESFRKRKTRLKDKLGIDKGGDFYVFFKKKSIITKFHISIFSVKTRLLIIILTAFVQS
ncbi:response regulator [Fulvivirga maritima]|uniref:response regulator n=1 Tax=Fulvivirga maritima TaxID=2904247 RepID=UPI001F1E0270|nr:response regulator [Fulvivirga maritima]UII27012.1 response regulator [Fulvivirga maritima]